MSWKRKKRVQGKNKNHSLSKKLKQDKKITEEFEVMMNNLSLEELIGLKLELAAKAAGGMLYGLPLWSALPDITKDAIVKYAYSATSSKVEAARLLGINKVRFNKLLKQYKTESYFEEKI
jgi:hypothetical protein